jgi:DNA polymerase elongation subunit (family B)
MTKERPQIDSETISAFLEGRDPQKYIVNIEAPYHVPKADVIINDPEKGKYIESRSFKPFLWLKPKVFNMLYDGNRKAFKEAKKRFGIKFKLLRTTHEDGFEPERMKTGYTYMAQTKQCYSNLINFFRQGGIDIYHEKYRDLFMAISPVEQFMIQTGKRMFKGFDDYDDLNRFQFDLETTGLNPEVDTIFQIGVRNNKGFEYILEVKGDTPTERRESERQVIKDFFIVISRIQPDVITGFNSENFDWEFFDVRCQRLGMTLKNVAITLDNEKGQLKRKDSVIKLGGETEHYKQTHMWGYTILDIWHAVRKAKAINSDIKKTNLKYITQFSKIAKPNRVYVPGDILNKTWADKENRYFLNDSNGEWFKYLDPTEEKNADVSDEVKSIQKKKIASGDYEEVKGDYIVQRYLLDDLWETEKVDSIYNQATFLVSKLLPTTFMRAATMGTASTWKLIMMAWSYENNLAVPALEPKRQFTGGLSRLVEVGFARRVAKLDYAALYPNIELTHDIFPDIDITGVMKGLLFYIVDQRDTYKFLKNDHKVEAKKYKELLAKDPDNEEYKQKYKEHDYLSSGYDKKQLPLKILANSFFGSFGASYLFNWGDVDSAEETTCRGRQYLRLMVRHFYEKYGFRPLVGDTDGFNFAIPDSVDEISYHVKGTHRLTEENAGKTLYGLDAVVADFNEEYMIGRMGLDIDDVCESTINFSRKNYGNKIDGKIKLVGNTIKSTKLPGYIEDFLNKAIELLLDDKGKEFVDLYYETIDNIFNYRIPVAKIASKSKVNQTMAQYEEYCKGTNKAGVLNSRKAFMELIKADDLKVNLGDMIYYVNTGTAKSHGDLKTVKEDGVITKVELRCEMIPAAQLEKNPDLIITNYNVPKYIENLNKRIKPLLVCFDSEVRDKIKIDVKKNRKTKEFELTERHQFTTNQCKLISGKPYKEGDQDSYEDLMRLDDKEFRFWISVNKVPNNMEVSEWEEMKADYLKRMAKKREDEIKAERVKLMDKFKSMKPNDFVNLIENKVIPKEILAISKLGIVKDYEGNDVGLGLMSIKHDEKLFFFEEFLRMEPYVIYKAEFMETLKKMPLDKKEEKWEEHLKEVRFTYGESYLDELIKSKAIRPYPEVPVLPEPPQKEEVVEETTYEEEDLSQEVDEDEEVWNF